MRSSQPQTGATPSESVLEEIQTHLRSRINETVELGANTHITRDLGLDSLAIMDFIFDLEDSFDISIPMERIAEVKTVADLAAAVETIQKEGA